jgi:hypothetical protein
MVLPIEEAFVSIVTAMQGCGRVYFDSILICSAVLMKGGRVQMLLLVFKGSGLFEFINILHYVCELVFISIYLV